VLPDVVFCLIVALPLGNSVLPIMGTLPEIFNHANNEITPQIPMNKFKITDTFLFAITDEGSTFTTDAIP
jgi:hypothetical protein